MALDWNTIWASRLVPRTRRAQIILKSQIYLFLESLEFEPILKRNLLPLFFKNQILNSAKSQVFFSKNINTKFWMSIWRVLGKFHKLFLSFFLFVYIFIFLCWFNLTFFCLSICLCKFCFLISFDLNSKGADYRLHGVNFSPKYNTRTFSLKLYSKQ